MDIVIKIEEDRELFGFDDVDPLLIILRHYDWSTSKMKDWFTESDDKKYEIGVEFNERLAEQHPEINASLPANHGGYCMICYDELSEENQFALACKHTFCQACWKDYLTDKVLAGYTGIDSLCM